MFDQQALWTRNVITNRIQLPGQQVMLEDARNWVKKAENGMPDYLAEIPFQLAYIQDLCNENQRLNSLDISSRFVQTARGRHDSLNGYVRSA